MPAPTQVVDFRSPISGRIRSGSKSMTQNDMVEVEELVREIARALVDEPSAVEVESVGRD